MLGFRRKEDVPLTVDDFIDDYEERTGRKDVSDYARACVENRIPTRYHAGLAIVKAELLHRGWSAKVAADLAQHDGQVSWGLVSFQPDVERDLSRHYPNEAIESAVLREVAARLGGDERDVNFLHDSLKDGLQKYKAARGTTAQQ